MQCWLNKPFLLSRLRQGLKRLCRNRCRRYAAPRFFTLYPGLTPGAHNKAAASRLVYPQSHRFVPPVNLVDGCDTVSKARHFFDVLRARLKSCPDAKLSAKRVFPQAVNRLPLQGLVRHCSTETKDAARRLCFVICPRARGHETVSQPVSPLRGS
jgi:hypothetical protein